MMKNVFLIFVVLISLNGCASVKMEDSAISEKSKQFAAPSLNNAGLYIYREGILGSALKKDIWVDGVCLGESAPNVFFYTEVSGNTNHTISTESEFSPNDLRVMFDSGKNYFVRQFIKLGLFVGGAGLELVPETVGKVAVKKLDQAARGTCS